MILDPTSSTDAAAPVETVIVQTLADVATLAHPLPRGRPLVETGGLHPASDRRATSAQPQALHSVGPDLRRPYLVGVPRARGSLVRAQAGSLPSNLCPTGS